MSEKSKVPTAVATDSKSKLDRKTKTTPKQLPPYNVVLLDDDDHTYEYVMEMLATVFGYNLDEGFRLAREVDESGRVIVLTTHKERAELKREQIIGYGADPRISRCKGPMAAIIELAPA